MAEQTFTSKGSLDKLFLSNEAEMFHNLPAPNLVTLGVEVVPVPAQVPIETLD